MIVRTQKSGWLIQIKMLPSDTAVVQNKILTSPSHHAYPRDRIWREVGVVGLGLGWGGGGGK